MPFSIDPDADTTHAEQTAADMTGHTDAMPAASPGAEASADDGVWRIGARYRVLERVGSGGMADVMRAHDELLHRDVAVKVFRAVTHASDTAVGHERQRAELHALARLNHPNLITLFDGSIGEVDGPAYLVMELIDGPTLAARIAEAPIPVDEARDIAVQISDALAYVHAAGMVHRDVKPANILLGHDRTADAANLRARLSDFGIVRLLGSEGMTSADLTLGTASYLAPEQARGSAVEPPADIYALGLTLLESLTGVRAFEGTPLEAAVARLERDPWIPAELPVPWPVLLAGMTARDPATRPTAVQVASRLRAGDSATGPMAALAVAAAVATAALAAPADMPVQVASPVGALGPVRPAGVTEPAAFAAPAQRRRGPASWLLLASAAVIAIAIGGFVLLGPTGTSGGTSPTVNPVQPARHSAIAPSRSTRDTAPAAVTTKSASRSATRSAASSTASTSPSSRVSSTPASSTPTTTAASSTTQPQTSSSTASSSSAGSSTSAGASSSASTPPAAPGSSSTP